MKRPLVVTIASAPGLCIWEESMIEQGALPKPTVQTAPVKISSPSAEKAQCNPPIFLKTSNAECTNFHAKPSCARMVLFGVSLLKSGALFRERGSSNIQAGRHKLRWCCERVPMYIAC